jgi:2'-5' RNA ligase
MPFAITMPLDAQSAPRVVALWRHLADAGCGDGMLRLGYTPHVTLAICPDDTPEPTLRAALTQIARTCAATSLTLASLGTFTGPPATLFLAPVVTAELLALHATTLATLAAVEVSPHYRSGCWVPHVTLAEELPAPGTAIAALAEIGLPIPACVERVELVRFRPVRVLAALELSDARDA